MITLKERSVLVVGGSSGIGFETAAAAGSAGASVTIASRSEPRLKAAAAKLGGNVEPELCACAGAGLKAET